MTTVIYLAGRLPGRSSDLPESHNGPDQPCSLIWPCSRWGLPSQPVSRLLVGSYIKELALPHLFTLTCQGSGIRSQESGIRSQESGIRDQESSWTPDS